MALIAVAVLPAVVSARPPCWWPFQRSAQAQPRTAPEAPRTDLRPAPEARPVAPPQNQERERALRQGAEARQRAEREAEQARARAEREAQQAARRAEEARRNVPRGPQAAPERPAWWQFWK